MRAMVAQFCWAAAFMDTLTTPPFVVPNGDSSSQCGLKGIPSSFHAAISAAGLFEIACESNCRNHACGLRRE